MCMILHHKYFQEGVYSVQRFVDVIKQVPETYLFYGEYSYSAIKEARLGNYQRVKVDVQHLHQDVLGVNVQQEDIPHIKNLGLNVDGYNEPVAENLPVAS